MRVGNDRRYIDQSEIWEIPPNESGHFKFRVHGLDELKRGCSNCNIKVKRATLVIEFVEPEFGNTQQIRENMTLVVIR